MRLFCDTGLLAFESNTSPNVLAPASGCCFSIIQFRLSPWRSTCWLLWFIFSTFSVLVILNGIQFVMLSHCLTILKYWCDVLMASQSKLLVDVKSYKAVAYTCEWKVSRISREEKIKYSKNNRTRTKGTFGIPFQDLIFYDRSNTIFIIVQNWMVLYIFNVMSHIDWHW